MPKYISTTALDYSTLAGFRKFISDITDGIVAAGCAQTNDTGQLDSVDSITAIPSALSNAYFRVYRFNDSHQSNLPIFFKFTFTVTSTSTSVNAYTILIDVGTGSDGSGNITGKVNATQISNTAASAHSNSSMGYPAGTTEILPSYFCHTEGFFGMVLWAGAAKVGAYRPTAGCFFWFTISRTTNDSGAITLDGFYVVNRGTLSQHNNINTARDVTYIANFQGLVSPPITGGALVIGGTSGSTLNGSVQVYKHFIVAGGAIRQIPTIGAVSIGITNADEFDIALIGTVPRHYIYMGPTVNPADAMAPSNLPPNASLVMLWED